MVQCCSPKLQLKCFRFYSDFLVKTYCIRIYVYMQFLMYCTLYGAFKKNNSYWKYNAVGFRRTRQLFKVYCSQLSLFTPNAKSTNLIPFIIHQESSWTFRFLVVIVENESASYCSAHNYEQALYFVLIRP